MRVGSISSKKLYLLSLQHLIGSSITDNDIASTLKDALTVGSTNVVSQLSAVGGFNNDANIRIPLPDSLQTVQKNHE